MDYHTRTLKLNINNTTSSIITKATKTTVLPTQTIAFHTITRHRFAPRQTNTNHSQPFSAMSQPQKPASLWEAILFCTIVFQCGWSALKCAQSLLFLTSQSPDCLAQGKTIMSKEIVGISALIRLTRITINGLDHLKRPTMYTISYIVWCLILYAIRILVLSFHLSNLSYRYTRFDGAIDFFVVYWTSLDIIFWYRGGPASGIGISVRTQVCFFKQSTVTTTCWLCFTAVTVVTFVRSGDSLFAITSSILAAWLVVHRVPERDENDRFEDITDGADGNDHDNLNDSACAIPCAPSHFVLLSPTVLPEAFVRRNAIPLDHVASPNSLRDAPPSKTSSSTAATTTCADEAGSFCSYCKIEPISVDGQIYHNCHFRLSDSDDDGASPGTLGNLPSVIDTFKDTMTIIASRKIIAPGNSITKIDPNDPVEPSPLSTPSSDTPVSETSACRCDGYDADNETPKTSEQAYGIRKKSTSLYIRTQPIHQCNERSNTGRSSKVAPCLDFVPPSRSLYEHLGDFKFNKRRSRFRNPPWTREDSPPVSPRTSALPSSTQSSAKNLRAIFENASNSGPRRLKPLPTRPRTPISEQGKILKCAITVRQRIESIEMKIACAELISNKQRGYVPAFAAGNPPYAAECTKSSFTSSTIESLTENRGNSSLSSPPPSQPPSDPSMSDSDSSTYTERFDWPEYVRAPWSPTYTDFETSLFADETMSMPTPASEMWEMPEYLWVMYSRPEFGFMNTRLHRRRNAITPDEQMPDFLDISDTAFTTPSNYEGSSAVESISSNASQYSQTSTGTYHWLRRRSSLRSSSENQSTPSPESQAMAEPDNEDLGLAAPSRPNSSDKSDESICYTTEPFWEAYSLHSPTGLSSSPSHFSDLEPKDRCPP
jgi:hypothetical protein